MHERIFDVSCISISCINRISLPQDDRIHVKHRTGPRTSILKIFDKVFLSLSPKLSPKFLQLLDSEIEKNNNKTVPDYRRNFLELNRFFML